MRILIADAFSEAHLDAFRKLGLEVDYRPSLTKDQCAHGARGKD